LYVLLRHQEFQHIFVFSLSSSDNVEHVVHQ